MPTDSTLATIIGSAGASLVIGIGVGIDRYIKLRKQLVDVKSTESQGKREIAQDETDTGSLKLLLDAATSWKKQYDAAIIRETRNRRLLAIAEAKMRRFIEQAAEDRAEDRRKVEALIRRVETLEIENQMLKAQIGGRRKEDQT